MCSTYYHFSAVRSTASLLALTHPLTTETSIRNKLIGLLGVAPRKAAQYTMENYAGFCNLGELHHKRIVINYGCIVVLWFLRALTDLSVLNAQTWMEVVCKMPFDDSERKSVLGCLTCGHGGKLVQTVTERKLVSQCTQSKPRRLPTEDVFTGMSLSSSNRSSLIFCFSVVFLAPAADLPPHVIFTTSI